MAQLNVVSIKDPMSLNTLDEVVAEIKISLLNLKDLAKTIDFSITEQREKYYNNFTFLKRFYERAERIVLDEASR